MNFKKGEKRKGRMKEEKKKNVAYKTPRLINFLY